MRRQRQIFFCVFAIGLLAASFALTQATPSTPAPQLAQPASTPASQQVHPAPSQNPYYEDSDNLNKMAIELKQQVDKSTKDQLSLVVIREANTIENLAHSVRQRMRPEGGAH